MNGKRLREKKKQSCCNALCFIRAEAIFIDLIVIFIHFIPIFGTPSGALVYISSGIGICIAFYGLIYAIVAKVDPDCDGRENKYIRNTMALPAASIILPFLATIVG